MEDILLSQKQYQALLKRLDEINEDVTSIKFKSQPEVGYIDNYDLLELLHVTNRTVQQWRKSGQLLFIDFLFAYRRMGRGVKKQIYYNTRVNTYTPYNISRILYKLPCLPYLPTQNNNL